MKSSSDRAGVALAMTTAALAMGEPDVVDAAVNEGLRSPGLQAGTRVLLKVHAELAREQRGYGNDALAGVLALQADVAAAKDPAVRAEWLWALGSLEWPQGRFSDAISHLRDAAKLSNKLPRYLRRQIQMTLVDALSWSGAWPEANQLSQQLMADFAADERGLSYAWAANQSAWQRIYGAGRDSVWPLMQQYLQIAEQVGSAYNLTQARISAAYMLAESEKPDDAAALLAKADADSLQSPVASLRIYWLETAARIAMVQQREKEALLHINAALDRAAQIQGGFLRAALLNSRATIHAASGRHEAAMSDQGEAMKLRLQATQDESAGQAERMERLSQQLAEREAELLRRDNALQAAALHQEEARSRWLLGSAIGLSLLVLALCLLLWRNRQIRTQLALLASTDVLTGLPNRRAILEAAEAEFQRARRYHEAFSLAVIDLDHFKRINDRFGHAIGDEVLRRFARICRHHLRSTDKVGRTGGEEFLLLMPHTDRAAAQALAERLRIAVSGIAKEVAMQDQATTASVGLASQRPEDECLNDLTRRADEAMYLAKGGGRDQVAVAP